MRASALIVVLSLAVFAVPPPDLEDRPELPRPDGSGEVPEMILSMVANPAAGATLCPGDQLYALLPTIRTDVDRLVRRLPTHTTGA